MSENLLHITSYTGLVLFHDFKEEQIPQISNITNKKRKKDNTSELRNSAKKKTKAIHDDNDDDANKNNKKYFLTSTNIFNWYNSLNKVKEYVIENKKRPSESDKDNNVKILSSWICNQQKKFKKKEHNMKDDKIYNEWNKFINEYEEYFKSNEEIWYDNLNKVKDLIKFISYTAPSKLTSFG
jgi:hypothetical protein